MTNYIAHSVLASIPEPPHDPSSGMSAIFETGIWTAIQFAMLGVGLVVLIRGLFTLAQAVMKGEMANAARSLVAHFLVAGLLIFPTVAFAGLDFVGSLWSLVAESLGSLIETFTN